VEQWRRIALSAERAWDKRQVTAAIRLYRKAAEAAELAGEAAMLGVILHNLGRALSQAGDGRGAREVLLRARDLLAGTNDGDQYLGTVLTTLGGVEVELGDIDAAIACHQAGLDLARVRGDAEAEADARVNLGIALKDAGRLSEARDQLTAALSQAKERRLDSVTAHALTTLGLVAELLHSPDEAREHYGEALGLYTELSDDGNAATVLYCLASLHNADGAWDEAQRLLGEALDRYQRVGDELGAADCRAALASIEIGRGNAARARELHDKAARVFRAGGYKRRLVDSLVDLAAIARDDGRFGDGETLLAEAGRLADEVAEPLLISDVELHRGDLCFTAGDDAAAREHYARSAEVLRGSREMLTREDEALSFFGPDRLENIDRLVALSFGDPRGCVEWIERAKGQELLRQLAGGTVPHALSWADTQRLLDRVASDDPAHGLLFVHFYVRDTVTVIAGLRPGRDPDLVPAEISQAALRSATADPAHDSWQETERLLAPLLAPIGEWSAAGDRVLLCPHDALHRFPLHAIDVGGQPLVERNVVSYVPSVGVLRHCLARRRPARPADGDALILADADEGRPVPLARDQARALAVMLASRGWRVRCQAGQSATLRALEDGIGHMAALGLAHFAVHGFAAVSAGLDSGLKLADGTLTARRMRALPLDGILVCLGACDTGLSERLAGDELLGLVRSALQAGAGTVLATLRLVDELPSSMLLLDFHQRLLDGAARADALRAAQLQLRDATVRDVLAHLTRARRRMAGDRRAQAAAGLAEAQLRLRAGDADAAMRDVATVLSLDGLTDTEAKRAMDLREQVRFAAGHPRNPDYARRPFRAAEYWAPFMLIGDPAY
jgi:CHAT domain-containing protein/tetratricopeptide (TPR) repeat protein